MGKKKNMEKKKKERKDKISLEPLMLSSIYYTKMLVSIEDLAKKWGKILPQYVTEIDLDPRAISSGVEDNYKTIDEETFMKLFQNVKNDMMSLTGICLVKIHKAVEEISSVIFDICKNLWVMYIICSKLGYELSYKNEMPALYDFQLLEEVIKLILDFFLSIKEKDLAKIDFKMEIEINEDNEYEKMMYLYRQMYECILVFGHLYLQLEPNDILFEDKKFFDTFVIESLDTIVMTAGELYTMQELTEKTLFQRFKESFDSHFYKLDKELAKKDEIMNTDKVDGASLIVKQFYDNFKDALSKECPEME